MTQSETHILENWTAEKYLGDKIHKDGAAASITDTLNNRIPIAKKKCDKILKICNDPRLIGFNTAKGPIGEFNSIQFTKRWIEMVW